MRRLPKPLVAAAVALLIAWLGGALALWFAYGRAPTYKLGGDLAGICGAHQAAAQWYGCAVGLRPNNAGYHVSLAEAQVEVGRVTEAIGHCEEAARLAPRTYEPLYTHALALSAQGAHVAAVEKLDEARDIARKQRGVSRFQRRHLDDMAALEEQMALLTRGPELLEYKKRREAAVQRELARLGGELARTNEELRKLAAKWAVVGDVHAKAGRRKDAIDAYQNGARYGDRACLKRLETLGIKPDRPPPEPSP